MENEITHTDRLCVVFSKTKMKNANKFNYKDELIYFKICKRFTDNFYNFKDINDLLLVLYTPIFGFDLNIQIGKIVKRYKKGDDFYLLNDKLILLKEHEIIKRTSFVELKNFDYNSVVTNLTSFKELCIKCGFVELVKCFPKETINAYKQLKFAQDVYLQTKNFQFCKYFLPSLEQLYKFDKIKFI